MSVTTFSPEAARRLGLSLVPTSLDKLPYFALLPKKEDGKATWKPFQSRLATDEEFTKWQRAKPAGWAIATGALSGRITFDFDGESGRALIDRKSVV